MNTGSDEEPPYHTEADLPVTSIAAGVRGCESTLDAGLTSFTERQYVVHW